MGEPITKDAAYYDRIREKVKTENELIQTAKQKIDRAIKNHQQNNFENLLRRNRNENSIN